MSKASYRHKADFDLESFLPFQINQVAEATSRAFQPAYRDAFDLSRTQWRVLAITARYSSITAREICDIAHEEKSKVSRAVAALESDGLIIRTHSETDKRAEYIALTEKGEDVRAKVGQAGLAFEEELSKALGKQKADTLRSLLAELRGVIETQFRA